MMVRIIISCLLFVCLLPSPGFCSDADIVKADSVALAVKYTGNIGMLTHQLTAPFKDDRLKARAIFRWVTENIAYDNKFYNKYYYKGKEPKGFECKGDSLECEIKRQAWEEGKTMEVLNSRKGVCQGYSMVFKKMCNLAGIDCEVVPGYVRTEYYQVGTPGNLDHAWNVVRLNTIWYLVDATWAAGGCAEDDDGKLLPFNKHYNDYYWLTPPIQFAKNHYPKDDKWALIKGYSKEIFAATPYYSPAVIQNIALITPSSGMVVAKKGDVVHFKLNFKGTVHNIQINSGSYQNQSVFMLHWVSKTKSVEVLDTFALKSQKYISFKHNDNIYEFDYPLTDNSVEFIDILFDYRRVMRFKVSNHKEPVSIY